jgi:hypothetical protein
VSEMNKWADFSYKKSHVPFLCDCSQALFESVLEPHGCLMRSNPHDVHSSGMVLCSSVAELSLSSLVLVNAGFYL